MNLSVKNLIVVLVATIAVSVDASAHILSSTELRKEVWRKIENREWAYLNYEKMVEDVDAYVLRFRQGDLMDPLWLMDRYALNRIKGKRYTRCEADEQGTTILKTSGDADIATVVYADVHYPQTPEGIRYVMPTLEEYPSLRHRTTLPMFNPVTGVEEDVPLQNVASDINRQINTIALKSAILYWLTDREEYGYLAADIFQQWSKGAAAQMPIDSCLRSGYFSLESVDDAAYRDLLLAYDFIRPFFKEHAYDTSHHQPLFRSIADVILSRGMTTNNWSALTSSMLVFAALNLDDKEQSDMYISHFIDRDTIQGKVGHVSLKKMVERNFSPEGYWKGSPQDHNRSLHELLIAATACEMNGFKVFSRFPVLMDAAHIMVASAYPNGTLPNFGDTEFQYPYFSNIVMALYGARRINHPSQQPLASAAWELIAKQQPRDKDGYWVNLLFGHNSLAEKAPRYQWKSAGKIDYARYFYLRNGMDTQNSLMASIRGASYMHNHSDALSLELYAKGMVMGIDPGMGTSLRDPLHVEYYSQWGAHNTVVPAGSATSDRLYRGGDVSKNIGQIDLTDQEFLLSDEIDNRYSFMQARYFERYTRTQQQRSVGLVRLSETAGYFIDFFFSNNPLCNDYIYRNVGDTLRLLNFRRQPLKLRHTEFPIVPPDFPGLRYLNDVNMTGKTAQGVVAQFSLTLPDGKEGAMQTLLPSVPGRNYFSAVSPAAVTADEYYRTRTVPTLAVRQEGEADKPPFVAIYEPYTLDDGYKVDSVTWVKTLGSARVAGVKVWLKGGDSQIVVKGMGSVRSYQDTLVTFAGEYMVLNYVKNKLQSVYVANATSLRMDDIELRRLNNDFSAYIEWTDKGWTYKTSHSTTGEYHKRMRSFTFTDGDTTKSFGPQKAYRTRVRRGRRYVQVTVPEKAIFTLPKLTEATFEVKPR